MKIDILDKIVEQDIFTYRTCKIKYSYAFENCLKEKISLLKKKYNFYQIEDIFLSNEMSIHTTSKFKEWSVGLIKNLLGLIPIYGSAFTIGFSLFDTVSFLKISDLEKIREKFQLKEKPRKKYGKIKNILVISNISYLNAEEIKRARFIQNLIEQKYIINTLLIVCEPIDFPSCFEVNEKAIYKLYLDNVLLKNNYGISLDDNFLKLINVLGIEYIDYIKNLDIDASFDNDQLAKLLITDMLQKAGYDEEDNLVEFLKLCSLLFDVFTYEDVEKASTLKNICCEQEIKKTIEAKLIESDLPNEYRFFISIIRKYYQHNAQFYSSEIKKQILNYLKEKYPKKYTDLAIASILTSNSDGEKISFCLKALYYDRENSEMYKTNEIVQYLSKSNNLILSTVLQLNNIYYSLDYKSMDIKGLCMQGFYGIEDIDFLSSEDKLICLSSIAKVSYEVMQQSFLLEIDSLYRKLLRDIKISTCYSKYTLFILDYVVFSTCIENNFETTQVVQRLIKYLKKSTLTLQNEIKYSRLGNALFYNDYSKGLELTKKAYDLSTGYLMERKYATVNYSCSLGMCGKYKKAKEVLYKEFCTHFFEKNAISVSATNNYIIVCYLEQAFDAKHLVKRFSALYDKISSFTFSDQQIICNNLLAAYIEEDRISNEDKLKELFEYIHNTEEDIYHLFYMHQNMIIYHFLNGDYDSFMYESSLCNIPGLLLPYSTFFSGRTEFLKENICNNWDMKQLKKHLLIWGNIYPEEKYSLYKNPLLFGFVERWFE
ncbi:MAG: hypothetical protein E7261_05085 [Lachnospiraceae bacterium]|nr:hypothetical protein [Lachnospiraceae bacterium]